MARRDDGKRTKLGVGDRPKDARDLVGKVVAGYRLDAELGSGAMGTVYRGTHLKVGRELAIKVMHPHLVRESRLLERFRREAKLAARLRHPNAVCVVDVCETHDRRQVMVLELAPGHSLTRIMEGGPVAPGRVVGLVRQILLGLEHAHEVGLIHRDLKPDNIIVEERDDGSEIPRIVDFGIAALRDPDDAAGGVRLTASGEMVGTPMYMAPEQARCEPFDHRVDLFALGVIVYELLCGNVPFDGSAIEIALANGSKDPPAMAARVPGIEVDALLELFARRLMARKLPERIASASDALRVLELIETDRAAAGLALGVMDVARAAGVIELPPLPRRR
jgi:serine/threonine protein kinase